MPGAAYQRQVWDWDSFLTDVGISQVAVNNGTLAEFYEYQKGCVQFLPIFATPKPGVFRLLTAEVYTKESEELKASINKHCYDERNGFYYSVDLNLLPIDPNQQMHKGCPRDWCTLIQPIDVWSGFMALWAGIASKEQAERVVLETYLNRNTFYANYGVRTLSKAEKMYTIRQSGNPSCWLGPIWGISNYILFRGLLRYGYTQLAEELYEKTITLFGKDIAECGEMHEYYHPDTGVGVSKQGFQSWNLLCANMI